MKTNISCPSCHTSIAFNPMDLLEGKTITCPQCDVVIGLNTKSEDTLKDSMTKLEDIKKRHLE